MTVTYPLALPNIRAIRTSIRMGNRTGITRSPFSASEQRYEWTAKWWECDITLPPMSRAQVAEWQGFLAQLNGRKGTFLAGDPLATTQRGDIGEIVPEAGNNGSLYDGVTDNGAYTSRPTGLDDGPAATMSIWLRCDTADLTQFLHTITGAEGTLAILDTGAGFVRWRDTAGTQVFGLTTFGTDLDDGAIHQIMIAADRTSGRRQIILDGVTVVNDTGYPTANDLQLFNTQFVIGALTTAGSGAFNGMISEFWYDDRPYDIVANLSDWRTAAGNPADLGADGSGPGAQPVMYFPDGDPSDNKGTGGNATITGALVPVDGPTPAYAAAPLVNGADQTGATLAIDGVQASKTGVFLAGDWFQLGSGSSSRLHMVTADADSNGSGEATLDIWPPLRASPADNVALTITNPKGVFRLTGDANGWDADAAGVYTVTLQAIEVV